MMVLLVSVLSSDVATAQDDDDPPAILEVECYLIGETWFTMSWETDEPALGGVEWGLDGGLGQVVYEEGETLGTEHFLNVTGLERGTEHFYVIFATDASNNTGYSEMWVVATYPLGWEERFWNTWGWYTVTIVILVVLIIAVAVKNHLRNRPDQN